MSVFAKLDQWLGRGSYYPLQRRLDPARTYNQFVYADFLEQLVTPQTRWLDGGCGHQILEVRLAERERQLVQRAQLVVGCDPFALSLTKHRSIENRVMCTLDDLPFKAGSFNLVTLNMVVEHLTDPVKVFRELARVLEPGGRFVMLTPNHVSYYNRIADVARALLPRKIQYKLIRYLESREPEDVFETHYRANSRKQLGEIAPQVGLEQQQFTLIRGRTFFYFFAPFSALELAAGRLLALLGFEQTVGDTILAVYEVPAAPRIVQ